MPSFNTISRRYTVSSRKNINSASKVVNWIIVDILKFFINIMLSLAGRVLSGGGGGGDIMFPS